ncbi:DUF5719 family protein [Streptomyces sp. RPT161]|uniref:DUF5719 family protein n=1 Tax=Streptomyces sp. RPT161 TaxID=3015993 RepID=UPI0022B8D6DC|nr:DUF5719 family protein [Streptomyces sp. RPT161]
MNRTTVSLIGVVAALAAVTGVATALAPASNAGKTAPTVAVRKPVERSALLCPAPAGVDAASTTYTSFTPVGSGASGGGSAVLQPGQAADSSGSSGGGSNGKPVAPLTDPGKPATATTNKTTGPLIGTADGRFAPGWTVQETTTIDAGPGRGMLGTSCTAPGADFWFPAASTSGDRQDYVHLTNPDDTAAVVDIELYDSNGLVKTGNGEGITVPGGSSVPVLLSTLTSAQTADLTVHVAVRTGRVAAAVQAMDSKNGSDWLPASAPPATSAVLPGIPADATSVHLVAYATGTNDADLKVQLLTPSGSIVPAGHETLHIKSGMTTATDLPGLTQGQVGSLRLTPTDSGSAAPFVAAVRVTRGKGASQEMAFVPGAGAVGQRASVAENHAKGTTLSLAAPSADATVKITSSATTDGGSPVSKTVTLKAGTTTAMSPPDPGGKGTFAVTVEPVSGGPVYASRMLAADNNGVPDFTIQPMPDDGGTVAVPSAGEDLQVLER